MKTEIFTAVEHRIAKAWYVMYPLDAYALGPYYFETPVGADEAVARAEEQFGEKPAAAWPEGPTGEVDEYEYELEVPA